MAQGGNDIICEDDNGTTVTIRTKPCWICGQHSYLHIPYDNWIQYDVHDVAIDVRVGQVLVQRDFVPRDDCTNAVVPVFLHRIEQHDDGRGVRDAIRARDWSTGRSC